MDEDALEDAPEMEWLKQEEELLARLTAAETREELQAEITQLGRLIDLAKRAECQDVETGAYKSWGSECRLSSGDAFAPRIETKRAGLRDPLGLDAALKGLLDRR